MAYAGKGDSGGFFRQVESVRDAIDEISNNTKAIEKLHIAILGEGGNTAVAVKSQASLDAYQNSTGELISELRLRIKQLQAAADVGTPQEVSVKRAQHSGLTKKLMDVAKGYQEVQIRFKEQYKDRIKREYRVTKPKATEEEIEEAILANTNVFASQMATQQVAKHKRAYEDINQRHQEILKIEKGVTELYDLFIEMQSMLEVQQEAINVIDNNVTEAVSGIEVGNKEMQRAIKHRKSSRKMSWMICGCVTIIFIIAFVLIYNYVIDPLLIRNIKGSSSSPASNLQQPQQARPPIAQQQSQQEQLPFRTSQFSRDSLGSVDNGGGPK